MKKILQKIFSVKNSENSLYKIIMIFGVKIKLRKKHSKINLNQISEMIGENNKKQDEIIKCLLAIGKKLAMPEGVYQYKNVKFYVPYYPFDFIQKHIVDNNEFFEEDILRSLDEYIPDNAVILDIGANIGNHTLYWNLASDKKVSRVHCFEPVLDTFKILENNIEINNLKDKVKLYNVGLNDCSACAEFLTYRLANIGDTHLIANEQKQDGEMKLCKLDDINLQENRIDFVKIDVEDMEVACLRGAMNTLEKYKPIIFIESEYENINEVRNILESIGYKLFKEYPHKNWLFKNSSREGQVNEI